MLNGASVAKVKSKQRVLHPTELRLNSELTGPILYDQPVTDVNHGLYLQSEVGELGPEAIDVNVKAFGVERFVRSPH